MSDKKSPEKMTKEQLVDTAKKLFHEMNSGVLSTISIDEVGYPFGSITPFSLTHEGAPVILISDLAQHTQNLKANPKSKLHQKLKFCEGSSQIDVKIDFSIKKYPRS